MDLTAGHVIQLAVVPDELQIRQEVLIGVELPIQQVLFEGLQVHWPADNLRVVE